MFTRCVALVLAATVAAGCHSGLCDPEHPDPISVSCEAVEEKAVAAGGGLLVLILINALAAAAESSAQSSSSTDAEPGSVPKNNASRSSLERRALRHAAAGHCVQALAAYREVRARDPAAARLLELDDHVAACLAIDDARARGVME